MRDLIDAHEVANDIRMTREQYSGSFLIVEGRASDLRLYRNLIDQESCQIVPAHSKENALTVHEILESENFFGFLVIVDADFWRLEGKQPSSPNLFVTDAHDIETMMLKSPAFEKLLGEFGSTRKIGRFVNDHDKSVRQALVESGRPLGYLRWTSELQNLGLTFEDIAFARFVDRDTLSVDTYQMIRTVRNKSQRHDLAETDLQDAIDGVADDTHDPWDVCCGHDLICILSVGLRKALGSNSAREVEPELMEKSLRLAYEAVYFLETHLFQSLKAWEGTNRPFRVFAS